LPLRVIGSSEGYALRAYHQRHHHEHAQSRFGVSSPLWDLVFGTYAPPDRRAVPRRDASSS
jgi:sterol desaturase/sphingolipid hydroxylase (fatty acid hydroxylase superfamily)